MHRIFVSEIPNTNAVIRSRITCGACDVIQTVYSPVEASYCAAAPRGSIAVGISRWFTSRCSTTTSASASALAVASASPQCQSMTMFEAAFS
jgi:hypothetical protein